MNQTATATATEISLDQAWQRVLNRMRVAFGEATYKSWLRGLQFIGVENGCLQIAVPTRFMREWVISHYGEDIRRFWMVEDPSILAVEVLVRNGAGEDSRIRGIEDPMARGPHVSVNMKELDVRSQAPVLRPVESSTPRILESSELTTSAPLDPRYTFDNFVVGKPNELAHAAAKRVAESPQVVPGCNPLFLYGGVGLGKTHLMHAIAWHLRRTNAQRRVIYLSAEKFMYQFVRALRDRETIAFKEQFRSVDVLMIDDVQFISGKDSTQEEFFHTFNALVDQSKQLVISADRSPSDLEGIEERIKSRLGWGLVADIHTTTFELRLGILQSKLEKIQLDVPPKVIEFLAHRITSNIRELEGALNRVVAHSTLVGRPITMETTQEVLQDLLRANDRRVTIEDIQKQVAAHFNIKLAEMHSERRSRSIARPRQIAMYLSKKLTTKSLPEIGRKFGGKDHTTVLHAVRRVEELCAQDAEFAEDVELMIRMLQS